MGDFWEGFEDYVKETKKQTELKERHQYIRNYLGTKTNQARDVILPEYGVGDKAASMLKSTLTRTLYSPIGQLFSTEARLDDFCSFASSNGDNLVSDLLFLTESLKNGEDPEMIKGMIEDHRGFVSSAMLIYSKDGPELYAKYNPEYEQNPTMAKLYNEVVEFNNSHSAIELKPMDPAIPSTTQDQN